MFTLESVVGQVHDPSTLPTQEGWPPGFRPGHTLPLAGGGKIRLPTDPGGLRLGEPDDQSAALFAEHAQTARLVVLTQGTFATPLLLGTGSLQQPSLPARGKVRLVLNAARVLGSDGQSVYGIGTFMHNDAAPRPGLCSLDYIGLEWYADVDDFAVSLTSKLMQAGGGVEPRHESNAYPWTKATLLLSGIEPSDSYRLVRRLRFAAGLFQVNLQVEFDADSRYQALTRTIKSRPPSQLLVRDEVLAGQKYLDVFEKVNPHGHADRLQPPPGSGEDGLVRELVCALDLLQSVAEPELPAIGWSQVEAVMRARVAESGGALLLSERALRMLPGNPYPDPRRMLTHLQLLADLAMKYRAGILGGRLEDAAAAVGLTIALFDGSLSPPSIVLNGAPTALVAQPHVKVDDHVPADRCGRIYFALDQSNQRLVVDHIGLHNYS